jgi:hypothetical protein
MKPNTRRGNFARLTNDEPEGHYHDVHDYQRRSRPLALSLLLEHLGTSQIMMDASGYKIGRAQREHRSTSSTWRGERKSTLSLSVLCRDWSFLPPRTESRSRNLPLWMKSTIAYAFSERVKKVSGCAKWSSRLPKHCESTAQLNSQVAAAIAGFFNPLDSSEQSPKLRPLLKVLLEGCKEVITQLATNMIVQDPDSNTLHVGDAYVNAERMAALYAASAYGMSLHAHFIHHLAQ